MPLASQWQSDPVSIRPALLRRQARPGVIINMPQGGGRKPKSLAPVALTPVQRACAERFNHLRAQYEENTRATDTPIPARISNEEVMITETETEDLPAFDDAITALKGPRNMDG